jgi:hypothetical protein
MMAFSHPVCPYDFFITKIHFLLLKKSYGQTGCFLFSAIIFIRVYYVTQVSRREGGD